MKRLCLLLLALPLLVACSSYSAEDIQAVFDQARVLNQQEQYIQAAERFHQAANMARQAKQGDLLIRSLTAEGECYYMLQILTQVESALQLSDQAYETYAAEADTYTRLAWREAICKLRGSYYYSLSGQQKEAYAKARASYEECLQLIDSMRAVCDTMDAPELPATIHRELLSLSYKHKRYKEALEEAYAVFDHYANQTYLPCPATAEDGQRNRRIIDAFLSLAIVQARLQDFDSAEQTLSDMPEGCERTPEVLRTKAKILLLRHDLDPSQPIDSAKHYYACYLDTLRRELQTNLGRMTEHQREQYWLSMHDFLFDCYRLEQAAPEMLYDLALLSKGYLLEYRQPNARPVTWTEVRDHLSQDACAVEFVQYHGRDERNLLGALVLMPGCRAPEFIRLADLDSLRRMRLSGRVSLERAITSDHHYDKEYLYTDSVLPSRIWTSRLMQAIGQARTIYFAADGLLQQLAVEYLLPDTTRTCRRLTSTRLLTRDRRALDMSRMLIVGDIDYTTPSDADGSDNDASAYHFLRPYANGLKVLPNARTEIDSFTTYRGHNAEDLVLTRTRATDAAFAEQAPSFPFILVSTHGFFVGTMDDGTDLRPLYSDQALSQSGIALAGAQQALTDDTHPASRPDGILSAKELSRLSLPCQLMVLSACQTGLGYVTADGVYGIQRALKLAGVQTMIVSLWSVEDESASMLMRGLLRNLQAGMDIHTAFMRSRDQLLRHAKFRAPQYANAFILIDAP